MAVRAALTHERLRELSDHLIAEFVGVSQPMVSSMRRGLRPEKVFHEQQPPAITHVHSTNTTDIKAMSKVVTSTKEEAKVESTEALIGVRTGGDRGAG